MNSLPTDGPTVMGIDPSFTNTGVVIVDIHAKRVIHAEAISTKKGTKKTGLRVADDDMRRCTALCRRLSALISTHGPVGVVCELPTGGARHARSARCMGMATGVLASVLENHGIAAEYVTPGNLKKSVTGKRSANKSEVQDEVAEFFSWDPDIDEFTKKDWSDVADAAGAVMAAWDGTLIRLALKQPVE